MAIFCPLSADQLTAASWSTNLVHACCTRTSYCTVYVRTNEPVYGGPRTGGWRAGTT
jgi:hypothetical protein